MLLICCAFQLVACRKAKNEDVDAEIKSLVERTISAGGTLIREAQVSKTDKRVEADWQIATQLSKQDYVTELKKGIGPQYQAKEQTDPEAVWTRTLPGDAYEFRLNAFNSSGNQHTVSFHFIATPD